MEIHIPHISVPIFQQKTVDHKYPALTCGENELLNEQSARFADTARTLLTEHGIIRLLSDQDLLSHRVAAASKTVLIENYKKIFRYAEVAVRDDENSRRIALAWTGGFGSKIPVLFIDPVMGNTYYKIGQYNTMVMRSRFYPKIWPGADIPIYRREETVRIPSPAEIQSLTKLIENAIPVMP